MSYPSILEEHDPAVALRDFVGQFPTQQAAADALHVQATYLSELLKGRRLINDKMLAKLGLRRIVVK